jgi:pimeloyl-ACP methyl ester carboxylesterase
LPTVFTYTLVDEVIRRLGNKEVFPNLRTIVVTGHSAGGQFTNRYAAATRIDGEVKTPIHYVVSNPSSYLYLDTLRLPSGASCDKKGACSTEFRDYADAADCPAYNRWHYGLENRSAYAARLTDEQLKNNLSRRSVTYLLGALDTLPILGFDSSCSAMAQGASRFARGLNYWNYVRSRYSANHKLVAVDDCGHNGRCMYTSSDALPVIFPPK